MESSATQRVSTGVPGLDTILCGGFTRGGAYLVMGTPGTGKTILGNQMCFAAARAGEAAVYVTLLAESHGRLLSHLRQLAFFEEEYVSTRIHYLSGYSILEEHGLPGLLAALQQLVAEKQATRLVIDGLAAVEAFAETQVEVKKFLQELQYFAALTGCTTTLLANRMNGDIYTSLTMVDGVLTLAYLTHRARGYRELRIVKSRGSSHLDGLHEYVLDTNGFVAYPRLESLPLPPPPAPWRVAFGIPAFDAMLGGGLDAPSSTLLCGPPGSGKSVFGAYFLDADDGPGLFFGCGDGAAGLLKLADAHGLGLRRRHDFKSLAVVNERPPSILLDRLAERILAATAAVGARRVFLDDLEEMLDAVNAKPRLGSFLRALSDRLAAQGAVVVAALEAAGEIGCRGATASFADNLVGLDQIEVAGETQHTIRIAKLKQSGYDKHTRRFRIGGGVVTFEPVFGTPPAQPAHRRWGLRHGRAHPDR